MSDEYWVEFDCKTVRITMTGGLRVRGFCHCQDCRAPLKNPCNGVTVREKEPIAVEEGLPPGAGMTASDSERAIYAPVPTYLRL